MIIEVSGIEDGEESTLTYEYYYDNGEGEVYIGENTNGIIVTADETDAKGDITITVIVSNIYLQSNSCSCFFQIGVVIVLNQFPTTLYVSETLLLDASASYHGNRN